MPIKFLLLGGGGSWNFLEGGVEVPILFLWAWGFFRLKEVIRSHPDHGSPFCGNPLVLADPLGIHPGHATGPKGSGQLTNPCAEGNR